MNKPEYLYRYTTVGNLEIIMKKRTIRFNPLYKMDDQEEQCSAHGVGLGRHYFISCWVDDDKEDIRMWQNYCNPIEEGVRIRLPVNPFSQTENDLYLPVPEEKTIMDENRMRIISAIHKVFPETENDWFDGFEGMVRMRPYKEKLISEHPEISKPLIEMSEEMERNITVCNEYSVDNLLHKVQYTDDRRKIYPRIYTEYGNDMLGDLTCYGKYKSSEWSWQNEWRYILHFSRMRAFRKTQDRIIWYDVPFDHYDLVLDKEKLADIQVTLSPYITDKGRIKVKSLVSNATESSLKI